MANPNAPGYLSPEQLRIEALNLASREAVSRQYPGKPTVEVAQLMLDFIEANDQPKNTV